MRLAHGISFPTDKNSILVYILYEIDMDMVTLFKNRKSGPFRSGIPSNFS